MNLEETKSREFRLIIYFIILGEEVKNKELLLFHLSNKKHDTVIISAITSTFRTAKVCLKCKNMFLLW